MPVAARKPGQFDEETPAQQCERMGHLWATDPDKGAPFVKCTRCQATG